jgi:uncharacterized protein YlxW (UPF0749 family)
VSDQQQSGAQRLLAAAFARPARGQVVAAVLLAILGFATVVQARTTSEDDSYAGARRGDLVQLLDSLDAASGRLDQQLAELTETRQRLLTTNRRAQVAETKAQRDADNLAILNGTVGATGPGVVVTIEDIDNAVSSSTLLNAVEELRDAGAEAIQINGVSRVVAQSYFVDDGDKVRVDGRELTRPFVIEAIGSATTLREAMIFRGGLADQVEALGGSVSVAVRNSIDITSLAESREPEYAQPST